MLARGVRLMSSPTAAESPPVASSPFVGRARELSELEAAVAGVVVGTGAFVLVSGEAGIGKTRLVEEVARRAARTGIRVVWGRCWELGGAPAFWPWVEILRPLLALPEAREVVDDAGRGPALIGLIPRRAEPGAEDDALAPFRDEHERVLLFDSVTRFLGDGSPSRHRWESFLPRRGPARPPRGGRGASVRSDSRPGRCDFPAG